MGFSTSGTHMIFFIASMLVAVSLVTVFVSTIYSLSGSMKESGDLLSSRMTTKIEIINDPSDVPNNPLVIYVKNTGSSVIDANSVTLLVDGEAVSPSSLVILGGGTHWNSTETLAITVNTTLSSGEHTVKVVTGNGVSDSMKFVI
jgi:flagellar protein FlaG